MAWEAFIVGTLAGVLIIAAVTAIGRILKGLASRGRRTRPENPADPCLSYGGWQPHRWSGTIGCL